MNLPQDVATDVLRELISQRVSALLSDDAPSDASSPVLHAIQVAALEYSARYLRSIMADRAASLLEERALEMGLDGLDLDACEGYSGHTIIGVGVRPIPLGSPSFP